MQLLRVKRRTLLAKKGHKLLKDKLDGLIRQLLQTVKEHRKLGDRMEKELSVLFSKVVIAAAQIDLKELPPSSCKSGVDIAIKNIMGVKIPIYSVKVEGDPVSYGLAHTPIELDQALIRFKEILPELVKLAEFVKTMQVLAAQIIEIKRRVNALEYKLIPELEQAARFIRMKLAEMELGTTVSLLKIKEMAEKRRLVQK